MHYTNGIWTHMITPNLISKAILNVSISFHVFTHRCHSDRCELRSYEGTQPSQRWLILLQLANFTLLRFGIKKRLEETFIISSCFRNVIFSAYYFWHTR